MHGQYHYIGLDIHKRTVAFCAKRPDGKTVDAGTFGARRDCIQQWAEARTAPWFGGMEATLFSGFAYDVLTPYALEMQVGHPLQLKASFNAKHKNDKIDAETLSNLLRADLGARNRQPCAFLQSQESAELLWPVQRPERIGRKEQTRPTFQTAQPAPSDQITGYPTNLKVSRNSGGRPPTLPLDFYLSWMSPFFLILAIFM